MSKLSLLMSICVAGAIIRCSKGSSHAPSSIYNTQYDLQNYLFDVGAQTNNCKLEG